MHLVSLRHHRLKLSDERLDRRHEYVMESGLWRMGPAVHLKEFFIVRMLCYADR